MDSAINEWLLQYEHIKEIAEMIHTEELPDQTDTLALQRSGVENLGLKYVGEKGWYRQYQYILLLKANSEDDIQRLNNLDWLDDLSDWIDKQNQSKNYPTLENKKIKQVSCANAITYESEEDGSISTYYLQLYFNVRGGI
jgi:hypothetical protein|nr:MAG TPA: Minor capsid protein from bacteriophage [Caudoviricetes sp.]DAJ09191.1 MAG TPA: Minor capsid protein from bacteriophage [Caudoviricetes sp.]